MKTIIHLELSDLERNDLAKRIDRNQDTKRLVTRKEVTELVLALIDDEMRDDHWNTVDIKEKIRGETTEARPAAKTTDHGDPGQRRERGRDKRVPHDMPTGGFSPSRGDEDYLTQPRDPDIAAACRSIIDATTLINEFAWETIERNRKK